MDAPIWKDTYYSNYFDTLEYYIKDVDADEIILQAYTKKMPGWTGVTLNINNRVDEYLKPDFASDFRGVSDAVIANPDAYKTYQLRDLPVSGLLDTYHFLYDWSYKDDWSGETSHNMSSPVKHLDPRMKAMFTIFDSAQTSFDYSISYNTYTSFIPRQVYFGVSGGSRVVRITSNDSWEITSMPGWLSADITAGTGSYSAESVTAITFTASANTAAEDRTGIVEFTHSDGVSQFGVSQAGVLSFDVTPDSVSLGASGGTIVITINTNSNWEVISCPSWVSLSQTTGGTGVSVVTATASTNDSFYTSRQDNIVIVSGGKRQGVCVSQDHMVPVVNVSPSSYEFEYTGGTMQLTIDSNIDWYITSYPKWATFSALSGDAGSSSVTVTAGYNHKYQTYTGMIEIKEGLRCAVVAEIPITLDKKPQPEIFVEPDPCGFNATGGTKQLRVISDVPWWIVSKPDWVELNITTGDSGTTIVNITASQNDVAVPRSGEIIFNGENDLGVQFATTSVVNQSEMNLNGEYLTFNITSNGVINWKQYYGSPSKTIEYRKNNGGWVQIVGNTAGTSISVATGDKLEFRGDNPSGLTGTTFSASTAYFTLRGNIESLVNKDSFETEDYINDFGDLFKHTNVTDASQMVLPATAVTTWVKNSTTYGSYASMFYNCQKLIKAPAILPATRLISPCYQSMFANCKKMTDAPLLGAETATGECYSSMFSGCSSLHYIKTNTENVSGNYYTMGLPGNNNGIVDGPWSDDVHILNSPEEEGWIYIQQTPEYTPVTFTIKTAGTIGWRARSESGGTYTSKSIAYRKNSGDWIPIIPSTSDYEIPVVPGDVLEFIGGHKSYAVYNNIHNLEGYSQFFGTAHFDVSGELRSLLTGYYNDLNTAGAGYWTYYRLFAGTNVEDAYGLIFDGTGGYYRKRELFAECPFLTRGPEISGNFGPYDGYRMFYNCSSLNKIITTIGKPSGSNATTEWVYGVASAGTFVTTASTWTTGVNGIPSGWTVTDA